MNTNQKQYIIKEIHTLIKANIRKAKAAHRRYVAAVRKDDLSEELHEYEVRDIHLSQARSLKAALLPYDVDVRLYGNLDVQRKRRLEREKANRRKRYETAPVDNVFANMLRMSVEYDQAVSDKEQGTCSD